MNLICVLVRVPIFYDNPFSFSSYAECFRLMKVIKSPYTTAPASGGFSFIYWKTFRVCSFLFFSYSPSMNSPFLKSAFSVALPASQAGDVPGWMQLFPSGTFSGRDGRGPYTCDPVSVVAQTRAHNGPLDIPVDYDHQLEFSAVNGQPAPAAGWITALEARDDGVWGHVEWTEKGRAHVAAREYRYVSPVYYHDPSGVIQSIESVALTNVPNLTGLKALASREPSGQQSFTGESPMSFLKTIASVLGVTDAEPTEATVEAAARMVVQDAQSMKEAMSTMAQTVKADGSSRPCSPLPPVPSTRT